MTCYRFDRFSLDPRDRQLRRDDETVELNSRYLDALALLVREQGRLVSKERFLDEVWRGVPVTDEALTQCIKTLRRQLGDDAARPRFIETVPKHGYRFVADVEGYESDTSVAGPAAVPARWQETLLVGLAGTVGGGMAGLAGGLFYGFAGASQPLAPGMGAVSILLVLVCICIVIALLGGAGVALGVAATGYGARVRPGPLVIAGGAIGGMLVGALVKLLGLDAFQLLLGQSPGDITGAAEGVILGGAVGVGAWLAGDRLRYGATLAAVAGGTAGIFIALIGGQMMGGSLDLLASSLPESRLRLDQLGALFGEAGFGPTSRVVTGGLEGGLFGGCVVGAMIIARRNLSLAKRAG